jgi:diamine N-acetyltransferase
VSTTRIGRVGAEAIPIVMRIERQPGYETLVGRWSEAQHATAVADPANAYLLGHDEVGQAEALPRGFAIVTGLTDPHGNVQLKRIAVERAGEGFGRRFVAGLVDWVFTTTDTHRLWLDLLEHNDRAHHVYRTVGFTDDGIWRESYRMPDGRRVSQLLMAVLRPEWDARNVQSREATAR